MQSGFYQDCCQDTLLESYLVFSTSTQWRKSMIIYLQAVLYFWLQQIFKIFYFKAFLD